MSICFPGPSTECYRPYERLSYSGTVSVTWSGRTCAHWSRWSYRFRSSRFPDESLEAASNYCRNPNDRYKPWCYYNRYGYRQTCDIPRCDGTGDIPDPVDTNDNDASADLPDPPPQEDSGKFINVSSIYNAYTHTKYPIPPFICLIIYMRTYIYIRIHTHMHTHKFNQFLCMYAIYLHILFKNAPVALRHMIATIQVM